MLQSKPCKFTFHPRHPKSHTESNYHSIRKNAATSPLLLLPSEVRENILIHLLGDNLIHIKYLDFKQYCRASIAKDEHLRISATEGDESKHLSSHAAIDDSEDDDGSPVFANMIPPLFRHAICVAKQSEQSAYDAFVSGNADIPEGESPEHYVASFGERHAACKMCGSGPMYMLEEDQQALKVDLNVLGVCRQLYEEANHLLWSTNTFSFEDPKTFGKFFGSLNAAQKRNLARIHISADIGGLTSYYTTAHQRARWDENYWGSGLKIPNLKMLRGVQTLHLCVNQLFDFDLYRMTGNPTDEQIIETTQEADMEIILRLRALPLKHVTVVVSDDPANLKKLDRTDLRWTAVRKAEYAESIRAQVVDPNGAELVKAEAEVANLARKVEIRDNAADRLKTYKSILKEKRADMVRTAKLASREEVKAKLAAKDLTRASSKSTKTPTKGSWRKAWSSKKALQEVADKKKKDALVARAAADSRASQEEFWREEVAKAREKLQRAMARLGATPEEIADEEELEKLMDSSTSSEVDIKSEDTDDEFSSW